MLNLGAGTNLGSAYGSVEIGTDDAERNVAGLVASVQGAARSMSSAFGDMGKSIQNFGDGMKNVGESMTKWISLPLAGVATAAVKFSTDFNGAMANVASLGLVPERVQELKGSVQDMAVEFGQSTGSMADGLYQLVSAYGDTEDTQESLRINTQAAVAGLATLEESIALTSAVTKGYGDTSAEAQQKTADLAFQTVKLGQTTFPELAASMGRVVPVAAELGETQEALFGKLATLTGVTGTAAEVNTQLRATYQAFLAPSEAMAGAIANIATRLDQQGKLAAGPLVDAWKAAKEQMWRTQDQIAMLGAELQRTDKSTDDGAKRAKELEKAIKEQEKALKDNQDAVREAAAGLGKAVVQSQGFDATLQEVTASADGNTAVLQDMFGSIEALNAVLALGGGQQDTYTEKLQQMSTASGAAEEAFKAQTEGVNELGFTMAQVRTRVEVMAQKLGDGLAPTLMDVLDAAEPLIDALLKMADQFANMDKEQQKQIITIAAVAVAIGPVVTALGTMISVGGTLVSGIGGIISVISGGAGLVASLGAILNPVGLVVAAVSGLAVAWATDFGGIRTNTVNALGRAREAMGEWGTSAQTTIQKMRESMVPGTADLVGRVTGYFGDLWRRVAEGFDVRRWIEAGANLIRGVIEGIQNRIGDAVRAITGFGGALLDRVREMFGIRSPSTVFAEIGEYMMQGLEGGLRSASSSVTSYMNNFTSGLVSTASGAVGSFQDMIDRAYGMVGSGPGGATALDLTGVLSEQLALIKEQTSGLRTVSQSEKQAYSQELLNTVEKLAQRAIEDGSRSVLDQASGAIRNLINSGIASELKFTQTDGTPSSVAFTNRLWELFQQIQAGGGATGNYIGEEAAAALGGNIVGGNSNVLGAAMEALLGNYGANLTAMIDSIAGGGGNTGGQAGTTVTNNYNFQVAYETQQSSGSVGQDVALLNALYGGS